MFCTKFVQYRWFDWKKVKQKTKQKKKNKNRKTIRANGTTNENYVYVKKYHFNWANCSDVFHFPPNVCVSRRNCRIYFGNSPIHLYASPFHDIFLNELGEEREFILENFFKKLLCTFPIVMSKCESHIEFIE